MEVAMETVVLVGLGVALVTAILMPVPEARRARVVVRGMRARPNVRD
jgi:hypothetical protein